MSDLQMALDQLNSQADLYETFQNYYKGDHPLNFASDKFKQKFGKRLQHLRDNLCKVVVDAPVSRLEVIAFGSDDAQIGDAAWQIWTRNKMQIKSKQIHTNAFRDGDAYAIVWKDPKVANRAVIFPQDDPAKIAIWRDPETGLKTMAAKWWTGNDKKVYLTLYYPDRLEKYISKNEISEAGTITQESEFEQRSVAGETFPLKHDLGTVPVFHFSAGDSLLIDVIPLQAGVNKALADLFVGMEFNSIRQRWSVGISYPVDEETGKALVPFDPDDQWHTTKNELGKFGEFSDMTLSETLAVLKDLRAAIATVSRTPLHFFQLTEGSFPSGEALKKAEAPFTSRVQDSQLHFGSEHGEMMACCLKIEGKAETADLSVEPQWTPATPVDQKEELENGILKKQLGWSNKKIQEDFGLDEKTIEEMAADVQSQSSALGSVLGAAFDQTGAAVQ